MCHCLRKTQVGCEASDTKFAQVVCFKYTVKWLKVTSTVYFFQPAITNKILQFRLSVVIILALSEPNSKLQVTIVIYTVYQSRSTGQEST